MKYYIRITTWITRNINANERVNFVTGAFGVLKKDASRVDTDGIKSSNVLGLLMLHHFKGYYNNLIAHLRRNFDTLLQIFLNSEDCMSFLQAYLAIWDMKQKLQTTRNAKRAENAATIGPVISI